MASSPKIKKPSIAIRIFSWGFFVMVLGSVAFVWVDQGLKKNNSSKLPPLGQIPEFVLMERSEKSISLQDLKGKVWVADFIFTSCTGPCPMMTMRMAELQDALQGESGVRFVSFSVDPKTDTPAILRSYADNYGADKEKWYFLTGDEKIIHNISRKGFLLAAGRNPQEQIDKGSDRVSHSLRFVLVDRQARIRGYYSGVDSQSLEQLQADVRKLLSSRPTRAEQGESVEQ